MENNHECENNYPRHDHHILCVDHLPLAFRLRPAAAILAMRLAPYLALPAAAATAAGFLAPEAAAERSTALKRAPLPSLALAIIFPPWDLDRRGLAAEACRVNGLPHWDALVQLLLNAVRELVGCFGLVCHGFALLEQ